MLTIRQLAARDYGQGFVSAGATAAFWAALPTLSIDRLELIIRELPISDRFAVIVAAIKDAPKSRVDALKAHFTIDELRAMTSH